ncbi:MAG: DUF4294 domain-containing protein [Dysgonamonadaceae bacterium]|jgi:hypothetical protein|nr:DUF4294 domain-containing protein [Dysgonamonadaceae bacterium]
MKKQTILILFAWFGVLSIPAAAQDYYVSYSGSGSPISRNTYFVLPNVYPAVVVGADTVACITLCDFIKYSKMRFASQKQRIQYDKLTRDVKKTLPYAKEIAVIIKETYEYMETLPDDKARQKHLNLMEKYLYDSYKPKMSKLTRSQGQLLIKLVDRETNSASYTIVDAFMGTFKAWTYNALAGLFGNSLKKRYDPFGEDRLVEHAIVMVEQGLI